MNEADIEEFERFSNEAAYIAGEIKKEYTGTDPHQIEVSPEIIEQTAME